MREDQKPPVQDPPAEVVTPVEKTPAITHRYHPKKGFIYGLPARHLTEDDDPSPGLLREAIDAGVFTKVEEK